MIRLYDLRHRAATLALAAGVSPKVVSEQLGHASAAFTLDTYAHVLPHMQDEAAAKREIALRSTNPARGLNQLLLGARLFRQRLPGCNGRVPTFLGVSTRVSAKLHHIRICESRVSPRGAANYSPWAWPPPEIAHPNRG